MYSDILYCPHVYFTRCNPVVPLAALYCGVECRDAVASTLSCLTRGFSLIYLLQGAGQGRAGYDRAGQGRAGQGRAGYGDVKC